MACRLSILYRWKSLKITPIKALRIMQAMRMPIVFFIFSVREARIWDGLQRKSFLVLRSLRHQHENTL